MADRHTPAQRSYNMSRIRAFNTGIERAVQEELDRRGISYETHVMELPGRPDFVFPAADLIVFVDGDFWHGYRYPRWRKRLSRGYWREKIERNRERDHRNHQKLRRWGWSVMRFWGHHVNQDVNDVVDQIMAALEERSDRTR